jgi:hypothetical protein
MPVLTAVKVFSTTMARDRELMGERITEWLRRHPELRVIDRVVSQSSDNEYHCVSVTLFLSGNVEAFLGEPVGPLGGGAPTPRKLTPR